MNGMANVLSSMAEIDFYRGLPPAGFRKGMEAAQRADKGDGDIAPETLGRDFFAYKPFHMAASPPRPALARATNAVQAVADSGLYDGIIWTRGSPQIEETAYWFNLLIDTKLPICGNAAQRPQGQLSADGPANIVDSVRYIQSGIWKDAAGSNRAGMVVIGSSSILPPARSPRSMRDRVAMLQPAAMAAFSVRPAIPARSS